MVQPVSWGHTVMPRTSTGDSPGTFVMDGPLTAEMIAYPVWKLLWDENEEQTKR
jgi:hypothetical protein